ncbi:hypothetical protein BC938DRAFT_476338 [Jimgerdemannia flammicorona]|uniref:polynucleotide adenylyltransferase n=1 Tax=Jimgerdemannia flammicorona TaxID=994334 RepID=A0A433QQL4_9FUNG|nr:hypothetical protein BC938DRAFT_476338 [Jimgerdemannia flammicorona]
MTLNSNYDPDTMHTTNLKVANINPRSNGINHVYEEYIALPLSDTEEVETSRPQKRSRSPTPDSFSRDRTCPWLYARGRYHRPDENVSLRLHEEILDFVDYINPTQEEHAMRYYVVRRIETSIQRLWPTATVDVFGSYDTRLYLPTSDIDLVVQCKEILNLHPRYRPLHTLANHLQVDGVAKVTQVIDKAKVPIIKFSESITSYRVDISFNMNNGIQSATAVKELVKNVGGLRELVLLIKWFLNQRGLNEVYTGGLGSYAIVCMLANFLQIHPKIQSGEIRAIQNLGILLIEFFELYGKAFNYDVVGLKVGIESNGSDVGYYRTTREPVFRGGWQQQQQLLLSVRDPTDPANDIARNSYYLWNIKQTFAGAYQLLTATLCRAFIHVTQYDRQNNRTDNPDSFLATIIEVSDSVVKHRAHIRSEFAQRILQPNLGVVENLDLGSSMAFPGQLVDTAELTDVRREDHHRSSRRRNSSRDATGRSRSARDGNDEHARKIRKYDHDSKNRRHLEEDDRTDTALIGVATETETTTTDDGELGWAREVATAINSATAINNAHPSSASNLDAALPYSTSSQLIYPPGTEPYQNIRSPGNGPQEQIYPPPDTRLQEPGATDPYDPADPIGENGGAYANRAGHAASCSSDMEMSD